MSEENIYRCESCGGVMEFDVSSLWDKQKYN